MTLHSLLHNTRGALMSAMGALLLTACSAPRAIVPADSTPTKDQAGIYPDYRDIVVPPNIAPLNIRVESEGTEFVAHIKGKKGEILAAARRDEPLQFDSLEWRTLLQQEKGSDLSVTIYAKRADGWVEHPAYKLTIAPEPIDPYLSYRLIEPSYELYRQLGLYQRNMENFDVHTIYENNRTYDNDDNHCINCHNYQNYSTRHMLFHVRAKHGGTVFVRDGKIEKRQMKSDSILAGATYPAWHPSRPWVVFSSNQTGQAFHLTNQQKIEVVDYGSDLIFYDVDKAEITNILKTDADLETFPCWAPDGSRLYYTSAHIAEFEGASDSVRQDRITNICDSIRYNVYSLPFDPATRTFGAPHLEVDCEAVGASAAAVRVSPDGRYLLFSAAPYGQFHIWHLAANLFVKDLRTDKVYALDAVNSPAADSYHTWSSNGRWIVFASRRDDGSYSRPYIAYFDHDGQGHKAFLLPQLDPEQNRLLPKSYNVPELTRDPVPVTAEQLREVIMKD